MQKRRILTNAVMSLIQVVILGVVLFILYRYIFKALGAEQLGIWSVVLAATSATRVVDFGLSGSVVKFVAKYSARGQDENVSELIQTAAISVAFSAGLILFAAYPFILWILRIIIPASKLSSASIILPYALFSLWVNLVASVFQGGLDGLQRIDIRSGIFVAGAIANLIFCFLLTPVYGLLGLAYAQIIQAFFLAAASCLFLKYQLPVLPVIPRKWNNGLFREMLGYGANFQLTSIAQMLYEPATKALLAKFGGLTMSAFYEMANRMVLQFRSLIISANQVLVPAIADLHERDAAKVQGVYRNSYRLMFYLAVPLYSMIIIFTPLICRLWIGYYSDIFIVFSGLLSIGWFLNTLCAPAYFANLGTGDLKWNTISHVVIGIMNIVLGLILGGLFGGKFVVISFVFSMITGSGLILLFYHRDHALSFREIIPVQSGGILLSGVVAVAACLAAFYGLRARFSALALSVLQVIIFLSIVAVPVWKHSMRGQLISLVRENLG